MEGELTGLKIEEERWVQRGPVALRVQVAAPLGECLAEAVLTHGLGEHAQRYSHVAAALAQRGIRVWRYDLRGHGRSGGRRGDAASYQLLLEDLRAVYALAAQDGRPVFLFGHSMGGQIVLRFLAEQRVACCGAVVSSPWLRLSFDPPLWQRLLALVAGRLWPRLAQGTAGLGDRLSRDEIHLASLAWPELTHQQISVRLFLAMQREGRRALREAPHFTCPLLLLHGAADRVTSPAATQEFFARVGSGDKQLEIYPEAWHELHNDVIRKDVLERMGAWMVERGRGAQAERNGLPRTLPQL